MDFAEKTGEKETGTSTNEDRLFNVIGSQSEEAS
jgi:hypothetical protein